jgi:formate-dependent nitrite reductase cytochrome c552 subunit
MFIKETCSGPKIVEGRKFLERTIESKFDKANVTITTVHMDDEPLLKQYTFDFKDKITTFWKNLKRESNIKKLTVEKHVDTMI